MGADGKIQVTGKQLSLIQQVNEYIRNGLTDFANFDWYHFTDHFNDDVITTLLWQCDQKVKSLVEMAIKHQRGDYKTLAERNAVERELREYHEHEQGKGLEPQQQPSQTQVVEASEEGNSLDDLKIYFKPQFKGMGNNNEDKFTNYFCRDLKRLAKGNNKDLATFLLLASKSNDFINKNVKSFADWLNICSNTLNRTITNYKPSRLDAKAIENRYYYFS